MGDYLIVGMMTPDESRHWAQILNALVMIDAAPDVRQAIVRKVRDGELVFTALESGAIAATEEWLTNNQR